MAIKNPRVIVGAEVFLKAVGNAARYDPNKHRKDIISKVGRKYFTVGEGYRPSQFEIESLRQKTEYSADWVVFFSEKEMNEYYEAQEIFQDLRSAFSYFYNHRFDIDTLRQIKALVDKSKEEKQ